MTTELQAFGLIVGTPCRAGSCSDTDSTVNTGTAAATIVLAAGETVTCTFDTANARRRTAETIQRLLTV